ncbi:MAG: hypothetical protein HY730_08995 [Candidatus Tectomicrobia bacterium]|uniref:Type IV conjugative transfer system protein TraV n=1 Tax=Tectimicrobiota bacterium TaxID=2528274 RepID=A0A933GPX2_UNCTE|nr:hypothetical protein [Candidatus Tectomicrobia bacterium]
MSVVLMIMGAIFLTSCGGRFACKETLGGTKCETLSEVYEHEVINRGEKDAQEDHGKEKISKEKVKTTTP